jgi:formate dehydrogenase major subunit
MGRPGWFERAWDALGLTPAPRDRAPKTAGAETHRTVCCFCSCGCGMRAYTRSGRLISLEGDPENPINEGTLCSKGAAAGDLAANPERLTEPLVRWSGERGFSAITWEMALDRVALKMKAVRDSTFVATEEWAGGQVAARRTDGLGFLGGAINTNEEAYLFRKLATLVGCHAIEHQARI